MTPEEIISERAKTHGDYSVTASIAQSLKRQMRAAVGWHSLNDVQKESLEMVAVKVARILSGDASAVEHWNDVSGYAQLVVRILEDR